YASGNRTVRGFEGVLSSFPPLPGDSIVKRDLSKNVETIARVLKRDDYTTVFLYGGRGLFDGMRSFAMKTCLAALFQKCALSARATNLFWRPSFRFRITNLIPTLKEEFPKTLTG